MTVEPSVAQADSQDTVSAVFTVSTSGGKLNWSKYALRFDGTEGIRVAQEDDIAENETYLDEFARDANSFSLDFKSRGAGYSRETVYLYEISTNDDVAEASVAISWK